MLVYIMRVKNRQNDSSTQVTIWRYLKNGSSLVSLRALVLLLFKFIMEES